MDETAAPATHVCVRTHVNGAPVDAIVPADRRLVDLLRDDLGLVGTKIGCEVGVCGVCTVLVDGRATSACLTLAVQVDGAHVQTVEGLESLEIGRRLQEAFVTEGGFQCGYCTSGQLMNAAAHLARSASPDDLDLHGYLCRCTGYYGILRAIQAAAS